MAQGKLKVKSKVPDSVSKKKKDQQKAKKAAAATTLAPVVTVSVYSQALDKRKSAAEARKSKKYLSGQPVECHGAHVRPEGIW